MHDVVCQIREYLFIASISQKTGETFTIEMHRKKLHKLSHINEHNFLENEYFLMIQKTTGTCFLYGSVTCGIFLEILIFKGEITEKLSLASKIVKIVSDFVQ